MTFKITYSFIYILQLSTYYNKKFQELYLIPLFITVDECISTFKGRICFKQYLKNKKKKFGIKFFAEAFSIKGYIRIGSIYWKDI